MNRRTRRTPEKSAARFLEELRQTGNVRASCEVAGLPRRTAYDLRERDPSFATAWEEALEDGADALEAEVRRRGVEGTLEPVFYKGEVCGHVRRFSDVLLIFLLKGLRPERYNVEAHIRAEEHRIITTELAELRQQIEGDHESARRA